MALSLLTSVKSSFAATPESDDAQSLDGEWRFTLDPKNQGIQKRWFADEFDRRTWTRVSVPHTWQVNPAMSDYLGCAWYARDIRIPASWKNKSIKLEFGAVSRDTQIWVNGKPAGGHYGSAYTPFEIDAGPLLNAGTTNQLTVWVDNRHSTNAIPYNNSFDWAPDGGIIRTVRLRATPREHIDSIHVRAQSASDFKSASIHASVQVTIPLSLRKGEGLGERVLSGNRDQIRMLGEVFDPSGKLVLTLQSTASPAKDSNHFELTGEILNPELWHFDFPKLYRMTCRLMRGNEVIHERTARFGIKSVEVRSGAFVLNGEPMRLMGVEWMPGSDPRYGMAEPIEISRAIVKDLKRLNCVLTRFHWQQDDSVLDLLDESGILTQEEIPVWGKHPLNPPRLQTTYERHVREMIDAHFNHASIFAWGLCNEIKGLSAEGNSFLNRAATAAQRIDDYHLLTYASNTLQGKPEKDGAGRLDLLEWNEYYGTWYPGGLSNITVGLDKMAVAYPNKGVVISEYGLCECDTNYPSGDPARIELLQTHTRLYREHRAVAGAIFFSYNDYRTQMGDRETGPMRHRVHGVVGIDGKRKPSWQALRREASPIRELNISAPAGNDRVHRAEVRIVTRSLTNDMPAYTLRNYVIAWEGYNSANQILTHGKQALPTLPPGTTEIQTIKWESAQNVARVRVEILRPTGDSALDGEWRAPSP